MKINNISHKELVDKGAKWLKNIGCGVVLQELKAFTNTGEIPDIIGWKDNNTILIECKTSLTDFKADIKKRFRYGCVGLGHWRFYLVPVDIITIDILPSEWGLIEWDGKHIINTKVPYGNVWGAAPFASNRYSEVALLVSKLRRSKDEN